MGCAGGGGKGRDEGHGVVEENRKELWGWIKGACVKVET